MNFYLDFEATQFSNRIISIGCTNEKGAKFKTFVKPKGGKISKFITELTGITKEMVKNAPSADEAFNAFAEWAYMNSENSVPKYFCYGDSDKDFIEATMRTMSDFKAVSFAASVKALLIDYAPEVASYLCSGKIALKKVVALIENAEEIEQKHDALEDAEMLRNVVENLKIKCTSADTEKLASMKSGKKNAPDIFIEWSNSSKNKFEVDTRATEDNYKYKCSCSMGMHTKYFDSIETAALWVIKYCQQGMSPKKEDHISSVEQTILKGVENGKGYYGFTWEANNNTK